MMRFERIRGGMAPLCLVAMLAGCGQVDSLLVLGSDKSGGLGKTKITFNTGSSTVDSKPSGLSKEDDPVVFLESAARFAENQREYDTAAKHWAHLTSIEPTNMSYVRNLAVSMRVLGRHEDAERVLLQALRENPSDIDLNEELAKTLIASGRLRDGVALIEKVAALSSNDAPRMARLYSATGVAFDRAERHGLAQEQYAKALSVQPYNASALNNLGLSYAMDDELDLSEKTLRRALVAPNAGTQVRQNLAMVLSLQGKTDEATRLVRQDLPPSMANQTVGFYGGIADQRDVWKDAAAQ